MTNSPSSTEDINYAISNNNPFTIKFVDQQHIWGKNFPDVPSINAHVSTAVSDAISKVNNGQLPSIGITITAEKGLGKTHLISRIRHSLQEDGRALFVYMANYDDLSRIKSEFLQTLSSSLRKIGSQGIMQWQVLAADLFFEIITGKNFTAKELVEKKFIRALSINPKLVDELTARVFLKKSDISNPNLVKALFWTLSSDHAPFAIAWLSGQELAQSKADELGLPNYTGDRKETQTFETACQILDLISDYRTLVLCFDELDSIDSDVNTGFIRSQIVAILAKDLRNRIKRVVLLMAMYPETLRDDIRGIPQADAVLDRIGDQILELDYLKTDDIITLVSQWLKQFYEERGLTPQSPFYPFNESDFREIGKEKPTARRVLKWCFDNWQVPSIDVTPPIVTNPIQAAFENELQSVSTSIDEYMEKSDVVGKALLCAFKELRGKEIEGVRVIDVEWINDIHLHLRIIAEDNGRVVKIGTAAILQTNVSSIGAALRKLINYERFNFTRGCLVRAKQISKSATAARKHLSKLLNEQGGEWVALLEEHIKPLIAIDSLYTKLDNYELTKAQVDEFIADNHLIIDNALVKEILSDPSGQEPIDLTDDDLPIRIPVSTSQGDEIEL